MPIEDRDRAAQVSRHADDSNSPRKPVCVQRSQNGQVVVMRLRGELETEIAYRPYELAVALLETAPPRLLLLDLGGVEHIDPTGLGTLVRIDELARAHGSICQLFGLAPPIRELLAAMGLDRTLQISDQDSPTYTSRTSRHAAAENTPHPPQGIRA